MKITQPKIYTRGNNLYISYSLNGKQTRKALNLSDTKANRNLVNTQIIPQITISLNFGGIRARTKFTTHKITQSLECMVAITARVDKLCDRSVTLIGMGAIDFKDFQTIMQFWERRYTVSR